MKKALLAGVAVSALAFTPAFADVEVTATVDLTKDVTVTEDITIDTDVLLEVVVNQAPIKFAESSAIANQSITNNLGCGNCAEKTDLIVDSGNTNAGMVSINQAAGNFNNQGTLVSAAIDVGDPGEEPPPPPEQPPATEGGFAEAQASADQRNGSSSALANDDGSFGSSEDGNTINTVNIIFRDATIRRSFNDNTGLVYGNQSTGNAVNQSNSLSLAFSLADGGVALSEGDLGQVNANNFIGESAAGTNGDGALEDIGIKKTALIAGSLNGNIGIVGVNQSVGTASNQANLVSVAAVGSGLPTFGN